MDAHLAKKISGELLHGGGTNDKLAVNTHETLGIELTFNLLKGHAQRVALACKRAESHHTVADGDMAHLADRDDEVFITTMGNEETLAIADGLTFD